MLFSNPHIAITHPLADAISVQNGPYHYADGSHSEVAFFKGGEWVTTPIEPFVDYYSGPTGDTAVYPYVPNTLIDAFLAENAV